LPRVWTYYKNYCNHVSRCIKCGAEHHTNRSAPRTRKVLPSVHFAPGITQQTSGDVQFSKELKKKKIRPSKALPAKVPESNHQSSPKSYVEAIRIQDSSTDHAFPSYYLILLLTSTV